jgi:hypothetical protein
VTVPVVAHDRVVDWPDMMLAALAVKEVITGGGMGVTVTVTALVAEPPLLLAVNV